MISAHIHGTHYYWQSHPPKIWLIFFLLMLLRGCQNQVWAPSKSIYVKFRYSRSIFWWKICPIFIFSSVFEHLHLGPLGGIWKKWKSAYLTPFPSFLLKNKHTFFSKTFYFHPEYTFFNKNAWKYEYRAYFSSKYRPNIPEFYIYGFWRCSDLILTPLSNISKKN